MSQHVPFRRLLGISSGEAKAPRCARPPCRRPQGVPRELSALTGLRELSLAGLGGVDFGSGSEVSEEGAGEEEWEAGGGAGGGGGGSGRPRVVGIDSLQPLLRLGQLTRLDLLGCTFLSEPVELRDMTALQVGWVGGLTGTAALLPWHSLCTA